MCGRYVLKAALPDIARMLGMDVDLSIEPRYNIAPTTDVLACRMEAPREKALARLRWGLIPHWAKQVDGSYRMINARAETVATKPAFREAFARRRCLVVADGFYEWRAPESGGGPKTPYWIHQADGVPFTFAGLWERWFGGDAARLSQPIETCTVITTDASPSTSEVHDRMPVILPRAHWELWLDPTAPTEQLKSALVPWDTDLTVRKVSSYVNNARHEGEACIAEQRELF